MGVENEVNVIPSAARDLGGHVPENYFFAASFFNRSICAK